MAEQVEVIHVERAEIDLQRMKTSQAEAEQLRLRPIEGHRRGCGVEAENEVNQRLRVELRLLAPPPRSAPEVASLSCAPPRPARSSTWNSNPPVVPSPLTEGGSKLSAKASGIASSFGSHRGDQR